MKGSGSLTKFMKRERTTMFELWGTADGSGIIVEQVEYLYRSGYLVSRHRNVPEKP